jgi:hypothetical protein
MQLFRDARVGYAVVNDTPLSFVAAYLETYDDSGVLVETQSGWHTVVGPSNVTTNTPFFGTFHDFVAGLQGFESYDYAIEAAIARLEARLKAERK